ncbi:MAG: PilZ domain-containing protein [Gammaproteobacteria bacterium]|nr:MAG: PilZ domain-containing protein [Gammaproteobacteria bacterium]
MAIETQPANDNQRTEPRVLQLGPVSAEVMCPARGSEGAVPEWISASVVDVSANGLQLQVSQPLETDLLVDLTLDGERLGRFELKGQVRWSRRLPGQGGWVSGVELLEDVDTAIVEWKEALCRLLDDSAPDHVCF